MTPAEERCVRLLSTVATLEERLDNARSEIRRSDAERLKAVESLALLDRKLAVVENQLLELKKAAEEKDRRRWAIFLAIIACLLTNAGTAAWVYFRPNR